MTERQTDITPEDPDLERPDEDELAGGTVETPDEPMGVQPGADPSEPVQPGIPDEDEPPQDA
jgi:hypothetical protein